MKKLLRIFRRSASGEQGLPAKESQPLLASTMLDSKHMTMRQTLQAAWSLTKPFFKDPVERKGAFLLLVTIGAAMVADVGALNWLNNINGSLWEGFGKLDGNLLKSACEQFALCLPVTWALQAAKPFINDMLGVRWKRSLNRNLQDAWVEHGAYHGLKHEQEAAKQAAPEKSKDEAADEKAGAEKDEEEDQGGPADHPEQRLGRSIDSFVDRTISHATGLTGSAAAMAWFTKVMWDLSGPIPIDVAGHHANVPGMLVMAALAAVYSGGGMWAINKIGGSLSGAYEKQQKMEADYQQAVARMQENSEHIAMMKGELAESRTMSDRYNAVVKNSMALMKTNIGMQGFYSAFGTLGEFLPLVAQAPRLLARAIDIGGLRRIGGAFAQIDRGVSWMVYSYGAMANYKATLAPLANFANAVERWNKSPAGKSIIRQEFTDAAAEPHIRIRDLTINKPDNGLLIKPFSLDLKPGDRLAISGEIGSGKTTLFRALAGKWDHGQGAIDFHAPESGKIMTVPQNPYMPLRNLRGIICYPSEPTAFTDEQVRDALRAACLEKFEDELDNDKVTGTEWMNRFSGGQKQCVAFARVFLHKPDILMVDEITSAFDPGTQGKLYGELTERLPKSIIISIAHNPAVTQYHNLQGCLKDQTLSIAPL